MNRSTRRTFLRMLGTGSATLAFPRFASGSGTIVAGVVLPHSGSAFDGIATGAGFGAREAQQTAALMRREFRLLSARVGTPEEAGSAASRMLADGAAAVVSGGSRAMTRAIVEAGAPRLAIRPRREIVPGEREDGLTVTPSFEALASALAADLGRRGFRRWAVRPGEEAAREAIRAAGGEIVPVSRAEIVFGNDPAGTSLPFAGISPDESRAIAWPVLWHGSLFRYGAGELNERFMEQMGEEMNEESWSGWIAVKLILEAALRRTPLEDVRIDGHKGALLRFEQGRLRQPVYTVFRGAEGLEVSGA